MVNRPRARLGDLWLVAVIVLADQVTKMVVSATLTLHASTTIVPGFLDLTHVRNTGAAFGILSEADFPFKTPLLISVAIVALVSIAVYATHLPAHQQLTRIGLALILGGAVGNLIDRARTGYVLDFVDVYWRNHHFWAFNVADSAITVGVTAIILDLLLARGTAPPARGKGDERAARGVGQGGPTSEPPGGVQESPR